MKSTTTKLEVLLKTMEFRPMTYTQIKEFLFSLDGRKKHARGAYDTSLYGDFEREGVLQRFCRRTKGGKWKTVRPVVGPFTRRRNYVPVSFRATTTGF